MSDQDKSTLGIKSLPGTLTDALEELKCDSDYLELFFNPDLLETYLTLKKRRSQMKLKDLRSSSSQPELLRIKTLYATTTMYDEIKLTSNMWLMKSTNLE